MIRPAALLACHSAYFLLAAMLLCAAPASAQTAAPIVSSTVSGVVFEDAPRQLPVDTRFSQAAQTVAIDLGLVCEQVEAYGWTITPDQQDRVNTIFTQTAQELARLGYQVTPQSPSSAAADITVYTASRANKDVLFMWSAGQTGLLLLTCDARSDVAQRGFGPGAAGSATGTSTSADAPATLLPEDLVGEWTGTYSCLGQGPTGGTLTISRARKDKDGTALNGMFSFYPLKDKNPNLPRGSYRVTGRYNSAAQRAILEPGAWLQRPKDYYNAVMAAQFNGTQRRVSAVFEGTTGCTSFEGAYKDGSASRAAAKAMDDTPAPVRKKRVVAKPAPVVTEMPAVEPQVEPMSATELSPTTTPEPTAPAVDAAPVTTTTTTTTTTGSVITPAPTGAETPSPDAADNTNSPAATPVPVTVPEKPPAL